MSFIAYLDGRPGFRVWLVLHLAAVALPPLYFASVRSRGRFSLRSLLIATICVACFIGLSMNEWRVFYGPSDAFFTVVRVSSEFAFSAAVLFVLSLIASWSAHGMLTLPREKLR
jgi:hypothetical protein